MLTHQTKAPETKSAIYDRDANEAFGSILNAFESFKDQNDKRLSQLEKRGSADVLTVEHAGRISDAIDANQRTVKEAVLRAQRPMLGGEVKASNRSSTEHKAAFNGYMRTGVEAPIRQLEEKALSTFTKAFSPTGPQGGWVAEQTLATVTNSPPLQQLVFPTMELYAMPSATQQLLDDSIVDIETWLAGEIDTLFAVQEGAAFVSGTGVNMPKGFLAYPTVQDANYNWGNIGYLATGVAGALPTTNPSDVLLQLAYAIQAGYRQNATWVMSRKTQAQIRMLKDSLGHYLWQPPTNPGGQASLMNFPLVEAEDMPQIATGSFSIAFGDFNRGYLVVDRIGLIETCQQRFNNAVNFRGFPHIPGSDFLIAHPALTAQPNDGTALVS
jgi:predicted phage gp36 major capsid-like protein